MTSAIPLAVATTFLALSVYSDQLSDQSRGTAAGAAPSIYTVASMAQLRPVSTDERLRAEFHDHPGIPISETANQILGPGPETVSPPRRTGDSPPTYNPPSRQVLLERTVCRSDAVVFGVARTGRVLLNRRETDFFTDFAVDVTEFVRPNRGPGPIVVSQRGAEVWVGKHFYSRPSLGPLTLGRPQLLFLRQIPKTQSFNAFIEPIPISNGMPDLASVGPVRDPRGPERHQDVVNELRQMAKSCSGR